MKLVTLITDFGPIDYYVALLKASIFNQVRDIQIVDINHQISAYDIMEGAFYLKSVYSRFPKGTTHVALVNSFYSQDSSLVMFSHEGHYFIGPNNGLFSLVFEDLSDEKIFGLEPVNGGVSDFYDLVALTIKKIDDSNEDDFLGNPVERFEKKISLQPVITANQIRATIIHVDHFGNVVVNLDRETFDKIRQEREFAIYYKSTDPIKKISKTYSDVQIGEVCSLFNSIGLLEVAINMGDAHKLLSLNKNETIQINFY